MRSAGPCTFNLVVIDYFPTMSEDIIQSDPMNNKKLQFMLVIAMY